MIQEILRQIEDSIDKSGEKDPLQRLRLKVLNAGLKAADGMEDFPELYDTCIDILTATIELYGELAVYAQDGSKGIIDDEFTIIEYLRNFKQKAKA